MNQILIIIIFVLLALGAILLPGCAHDFNHGLW